jgi:hypothetical protein
LLASVTSATLLGVGGTVRRVPGLTDTEALEVTRMQVGRVHHVMKKIGVLSDAMELALVAKAFRPYCRAV